MSLTQGFCPKCGAPSENGQLCGKCRINDMIWAEIPDRVECTLCPSCESVKTGGMWSDAAVSRDELAYNLVSTAIKIHPDVLDVQKSIDIVEVSSNRSMASVLVIGNLYGIPVEASKKVKFVWALEQCDRCCRIAGSYYEGIIQVRAAGRKPTQFELRRAAEIAYQIEDQMQTSGDRLSFVSSIDDIDGGIDITYSSQAIGNSIAHDITGALGGSYTTHPKLIGEKAGVRLYRVTYSLRLPHFSRGDVIFRDKGYNQILRQTKETVFVRDLQSGLTRSFHENDDDPLIGNAKTAEQGTIIYRDAGIIGLLDPKTNAVLEAPDRAWIEAAPGENLLFLRDEDVIIPLGVEVPEKET